MKRKKEKQLTEAVPDGEVNLYVPFLMSSVDACKMWNIDLSTLKVNVDKFPEGKIRKFGRTWIVLIDGMEHVFGKLDFDKLKEIKEPIITHYADFSKKGVQQIPREMMGLYFIKDNDNDIVYIGKSINIYNRLSQHLGGFSDNTKDYIETFKIIEIMEIEDEKEMNFLETKFITMFKPKLNKQSLHLASE